MLAGRTDGFAPSHQAALALADAMMTVPSSLPDSVVATLHRLFTDEQLVELTVDVMKWNAQKAAVALGTDVWIDDGRLTDLVFDGSGSWVR